MAAALNFSVSNESDRDLFGEFPLPNGTASCCVSPTCSTSTTCPKNDLTFAKRGGPVRVTLNSYALGGKFSLRTGGGTDDSAVQSYDLSKLDGKTLFVPSPDLPCQGTSFVWYVLAGVGFLGWILLVCYAFWVSKA
jgi:hypothetical protein